MHVSLRIPVLLPGLAAAKSKKGRYVMQQQGLGATRSRKHPLLSGWGLRLSGVVSSHGQGLHVRGVQGFAGLVRETSLYLEVLADGIGAGAAAAAVAAWRNNNAV